MTWEEELEDICTEQVIVWDEKVLQLTRIHDLCADIEDYSSTVVPLQLTDIFFPVGKTQID